MQQCVYHMKFGNVCEVKKRLVQPGLIWSRIFRYCCQWMEKASPCLCSHSGPPLQARQLKNRQLDELSAKVSEMWTKCVFTHYVKLAIISHWIKSDISLVVFSPSSAETNAEWGGKLNGNLMCSCIKNISTKNYQNLMIGFQVTVENVGHVFWDTV